MLVLDENSDIYLNYLVTKRLGIFNLSVLLPGICSLHNMQCFQEPSRRGQLNVISGSYSVDKGAIHQDN